MIFKHFKANNISKNIDKINWDLFTTQHKLNENLIELYNSNINWDLLDYDNLFFTDNFISKFYNNIVKNLYYTLSMPLKHPISIIFSFSKKIETG